MRHDSFLAGRSTTVERDEDDAPRRSDRAWGFVRLGIGLAQMGGATTAFVLLFETGVTTAALLAVVATSVSTTASVLLFGRDRPRGLR